LLKLLSIAGLMALALAGTAAAEGFTDGVAALDRADYATARRVFTDAALHGDAASQFALAEMDRQGQGAPADQAQALVWYRKAAAQDNPGAEFNLGLAYQAGQGVPRSDRAAADWYAKAAAHGYAGADGRLHLAEMGAATHGSPVERFRAMMDRVFGAGRWRETSGYRSLAQEDALRRQGAGTVPLGQRSHHSMGRPDAPGAYDIVVDGMSPQLAVAKLKRAREQIARVVAEAAHGNQGPHLHVEPQLLPVADVAPSRRHDRAAPAYRRIAVSVTRPAGRN
jgi:hypothetical protein